MYKTILKKLLLGTMDAQEYLCTSFENFSDKFKVALSFHGNQTIEDISSNHIFLGYKPLVIGISIRKDNPSHKIFLSQNNVCMSFSLKSFVSNDIVNGFTIDKNSTARLFLKKLTTKDFGDTSLFILEGTKGEHRFLSSFHQLTNRLFQKLKKKRSGNVGLPGNLYEQVRIAYAVPRIISIISVGKENVYNLFPTDLHSAINDSFYASSLRHEGKACKQVQDIKKIVISTLDVNTFRETYAMGKNHVQELKSRESFQTLTLASELFNFPLPFGTLSYKEAELIDTFDVGIHRLLFYKIKNDKTVNTKANTLSHIHQYYGIWRKNKGLPFETFLR